MGERGKGPIDFAAGQQSSSEPLGGSIPQSVNVLVDATGAIHLRPGITPWSDFGASPSLDATTSVDGITVWNGYPVYVTSDRRLHAQLAPGYGVDISDATAATQLDGESRPVLITTRLRVVAAGGGLLQKWEGPSVGNAARLGGSPPAASHVVAIAQRLVVNPVGLSGEIEWSDTGDTPGHETWNGEFLELESKPDSLAAIYASTGEVIGFGTTTVQTIAPDPTIVNLVPVVFSTIRTWENGTAAPYSFAQGDENFGFLDSRRRIQLGDGRSYEAISDPALTSTLDGLSEVSDCWGFRMKIASWDVLGWHFPTVGRTFVFDMGGKRWAEWRGFANGRWEAWQAKSHHHWADTNLHLIGLGDGTIGKMDSTASSDNGDPIVADVYSGFTDRGVDNWKQNISVRLLFRRGLGTFGQVPTPRCQLMWRDGPGAWEEPIEIDLGASDDVAPYVEVRSLGTYRIRQWRLRFSDNVPLTFVGALETFEVLES